MGIIDRREIAFDARALLSVVAGCGERARAIGLPPLKPTGVGFDPNGNLITFSYGRNPAVQVSADRLGALLVSYCIRARIPLPRLPDKEVRVTADAVVIVIRTQYSGTPSIR
jgi:hypothetical protein